MATERITTIPNTLSAARMVNVGLLLLFAGLGHPGLFVASLCFAFLTDFADGWLARRLHQTSALGSQLDSWADFSTFVSLPLCVWWLWPDVLRREEPFVVAGLLSFLLPSAAGLLRYGRLASFHTWGAKLSNGLMGGAVILLLSGVTPWPFRLLMPLVVIESIEEIVMTLLLPRWSPNTPSLWHALKIRRRLLGEGAARLHAQNG